MSVPKSILVAGATGKQGGSVVRALLKSGLNVAALTRNPSSKTAIQLHNDGARIVVGDMTHPESLTGALAGVDVVFAMSTPFQTSHDGEVAQGINLTDAAKGAGVKHLVFSSVACANRKTGIPHFETKYKIEQHIAASGVPYTVIAPVAFMENFIQPQALAALKEGKLKRALPPARPLQLIAVEDIGSFAAFVIQHPEEFIGERIDVAGDERSGEETALILSKIIGKDIEYESFPPAALMAVNPDLAIMMEWQAKNDYTANIGELRHAYPEVGWHRLEEWAGRIDWKTLLSS